MEVLKQQGQEDLWIQKYFQASKDEDLNTLLKIDLSFLSNKHHLIILLNYLETFQQSNNDNNAIKIYYLVLRLYSTSCQNQFIKNLMVCINQTHKKKSSNLSHEGILKAIIKKLFKSLVAEQSQINLQIIDSLQFISHQIIILQSLTDSYTDYYLLDHSKNYIVKLCLKELSSILNNHYQKTFSCLRQINFQQLDLENFHKFYEFYNIFFSINKALEGIKSKIMKIQKIILSKEYSDSIEMRHNYWKNQNKITLKKISIKHQQFKVRSKLKQVHNVIQMMNKY